MYSTMALFLGIGDTITLSLIFAGKPGDEGSQKMTSQNQNWSN